MDAFNAMLTYRGRHLESIFCGRKELLRLSRIATKDEEGWRISLEAEKPIWLITGRATVPLSSGKRMPVSTLTGIAFPDGSRRIIEYGIDTNGASPGMSRDMPFLLRMTGLTRSRTLNLNGTTPRFEGLTKKARPKVNIMIFRQVCKRRRSAISTNGKKDIVEKWFEPNGHILKTRKNGDDSTVQEYIYTPEGRRVAVICCTCTGRNSVINGHEYCRTWND